MATAQDKLLELIAQNLVAQKDVLFATSIATAFKPSTKQLEWVDKMIERYDPTVVKLKAPTVSGNINIAEISKFFDAASKHLTYPKVRLVRVWEPDAKDPVVAKETFIRIKRAGDKSRYPGSLVIDEGEFETYVGRIHLDGNVVLSKRGQNYETELISLLKSFALAPDVIAAAHGKLVGNCCFCNKTLEQEKSTNVGYGPTCAKKYNLPYGAKVKGPTTTIVDMTLIPQHHYVF